MQISVQERDTFISKKMQIHITFYLMISYKKMVQSISIEQCEDYSNGNDEDEVYPIYTYLCISCYP